ncbi:Ig-like domain-containing protein [Thalassococcus sp. BH17M4-6]|uniref:Ig-like domain-containing protein n=1 Tax=Thalassococcus sp. BH17M4-6 TaxID=3413148 RepID=UPI003BEE3A67
MPFFPSLFARALSDNTDDTTPPPASGGTGFRAVPFREAKGAGADITGDGSDESLTGTEFDDKIDGAAGNDTIVGLEGEDDLVGGLGNDEILGGDGDDNLKGDEGNDLIDGGAGNDKIEADAHNDTIIGGAGDDTIDGKHGTDTATFAGSILDFSFDPTLQTNDKHFVTDLNLADGDEGTDELKHVEFFQFDDFTYEIGANNGALGVAGDATTDEDTATTFTVSAYDFEGDALTLGAVTYSGPGTVTLVSTGALSPAIGSGAVYTFAFDPDGQFESLAVGDTAVETVTVEVLDSAGNVTSVDVDVTIDGVNDAPVAVDDAFDVDEDTPTTLDVLANDTDIDDGDVLSVTAATAAIGSVVIEADGTLTYTPTADYVGTDTISYDISDGNGGTDSATVTVTVNAVNDPPVADDDAATTDEDNAVVIGVLANDTDFDSATLSVSGTTAPANGSVTINPDNTITYTPDLNFFGTDSFTYTAFDGVDASDPATVTVTVNPVNDPPLANPDSATTDEDVAVNIDVLANDIDAENDPLTVFATSATNGSVVIEADGSLTYTPNANFNGSDTITYQMTDGIAGSSSSTVDVTVTPVNDAPQSLNQPVIIDEVDGTYVIDLSTQVVDIDGDNISFSDISLARGETLLAFSIIGDGLIEIRPQDIAGLEDGSSLNVAFTYVATDDSGAPNNTGSGIVPVTINGFTPPPPPNTPPTADPLTVGADEEEGDVVISLADIVFDPDAGDVLTITSLTTDFFGGTTPIPFVGGVSSGEGGELSFDPTIFGLAEGENATISLSYVVSDSAGETATNTITLDLTGDTPGTGNTPPTALDIPGAPGYPVASDPFGGQPIPGDVIVDDPAVTTFVVDFDDLVSDPDGPNPLVVTPGDLVIGQDELTGTPITVPYSFDPATNELTVTLADVGLADGESVLATLNYSVSDGIDSTAGQIAVNFVDEAAPPPPEQQVFDFEGFAAADPEFQIPVVQVDGFTLTGSATVIETDESEDGGGREPSGIANGQTTIGGDNVLVGTFSTVTQPLVDEFGEPVLGPRGEPIFETVVDQTFAILAPGQSFGPGGDGLFVTTTSAGQTFPLPDPLPEGIGTSFSLDGLSLNIATSATTTVTITSYTIGIVEVGPNPNFPTFSDYFYQLVEVDSFDFVIDGSTPATVLDLNGDFLGGGTTTAADQAAFDDIYAVEITTANDDAVVLDDILITV